jgi:Domain of unknown function (DUF362)
MAGGNRADGRTALRRRGFLVAAAAALAALALLPRRLLSLLDRLTERREFTATPPLLPHDPSRDRRTVYVARGGSPAENVDEVLAKLGGPGAVVGPDDVVLVKVSAQWWNQGMTNVAAVKRLVERVVSMPGFAGEVIVLENTHFRLPGGSGLARAFTHPSERNVDVPGWSTMGDLVPHFAALGAPVSFVGLVDAGPSSLAGDSWHDPEHRHGTYGGDGRGPIAPGEERDGYRWDLERAFRVRRSAVSVAQTPLSWPVFTSPRTGTVVDLERGAFRVEGGRRVPDRRRVRWISMTTANEHAATGFTGCCKSAMGIVDMSAGRLGTDPRVRDYASVHYFGHPGASWRMAGPLAHFARLVRAPDLYVAVAEWVGMTPAGGWDEERDVRLEAASAVRTRTVAAGVDPVAVDQWLVRALLMPRGGGRRGLYDLDDPGSRLSRFLREYRAVLGSGTLDPALVDVV